MNKNCHLASLDGADHCASVPTPKNEIQKSGNTNFTKKVCAEDSFRGTIVNSQGPNAQGKRRRSTEGAEGTNAGHENAEGMACVGVRLTAQLGQCL